MKFRFGAVGMLFGAAFALLLASPVACAQGLPSQSLARGTWEFEPFIGGGTGILRSSNTQFLIAGARVGKILTGEHLRGWARGTSWQMQCEDPLFGHADGFAADEPVGGGHHARTLRTDSMR